jgi:hypothetical protein
MITIAPRHMFTAGPVVTAADDTTQGFWPSLLGRLQHVACALHGHDPLLQYERNRIFLRCTSCGHESPGWEVAGTAPTRLRAADGRVALGGHGDLAVARRIA